MAGQARQWGIDIQWKNVTESFRTLAQAIPPGELIKTGWFSLQEAVAAIEVMDPKLDTGVATEEELRDPFLSVDSRFERGLVPVDGFSCAELVGVMDDLTAAEVRPALIALAAPRAEPAPPRWPTLQEVRSRKRSACRSTFFGRIGWPMPASAPFACLCRAAGSTLPAWRTRQRCFGYGDGRESGFCRSAAARDT